MATYALTGGATGIGAAIKQKLTEEGHRLIGIDIKDADIIADLSTSEGRRLAVEAVRTAAVDGLDGLVTCAGLGASVSDHGLIASVNYFGSVVLAEELADLLALRSGSIVFISSNSAPMAKDQELLECFLSAAEGRARDMAKSLDGQSVYSCSKQAVALWMRRNTDVFARRGIRMNAVAPGYTRTPMTAAVENDPLYGEAIRDFVASIPVGRPGQPEDIAGAVAFLLSESAQFVCGSVLFVDGGHDAMLRPNQF